MTSYDIEIEIYPEDDVLTVLTPRGDYTYSIESVEGKEIMDKIFGENVKATVYTQKREMSLEEWIHENEE